MSDSVQGPVTAEERIALLDALRGFALLGILLANIGGFSGWMFMEEPQRVALAGEVAARLQHFVHHLLIDGKFYTLFSLLFGAGFALQLERLTRRGADGLAIYRRRVLILLGIGLIHSFLIWDGDILTLYALLGLVLPLFHRSSDRMLLVWAFVLIFLVPPVGIAAVKALGISPSFGLIALSDSIAQRLGVADPQDAVSWLRREDFGGWFAFIASGPSFSWGIRFASWRIPKVLGIMLLGMWVGRRLTAGRLLADRRFLRRVLFVGLAIGLPASLAYALTEGLGQSDWPSLVGTVPMALAFAAAFALAWPRARWLTVFAAPGRMALTNYLAQSVICILLFYGIGLGQVGYWPPHAFYAFAIALFALQAAFSHWWLASHQQGPMEALWRRLTYAGRTKTAAIPAV